ncbi:MAG TPA: hypothetical protein VKP65_23730 [Rhodothermales bacterium]|nr:hypothetical protein [Rhodothermales bacterium]
MSEIDSKYASLGGTNGFLGKPTSSETACPDKVGRYRHYEHGSIYWHPQIEAHEVHGLIRAKWAKLGWERSFLGYPKTDESASSGGAKGHYNLFQGGAIIWKQGAKEAFEMHGAIRSKFGQMGWEAGLLGFPTTDETNTPDGIGRYNHCEKGSIYWKPSISAHEIHGHIDQYWAKNGWEKNPELGYPISDILPTYAGSKHMFSDFENGVVYWKHGGAHATGLTNFPIGSLPAAEVFAPLKEEIVKALKSDSHVYIKKGPTLAGVTDYHWDGSKVRNRLYRIHVDVGIDIPVGPDPTSNLGFRVEIAFDREKGTIWASIFDASFHTHVPWPTSAFAKAAGINALYKEAIDPLIGIPQGVKTIPAKMHLLSAKVMPNGDLNVYLQPPLDK